MSWTRLRVALVVGVILIGCLTLPLQAGTRVFTTSARVTVSSLAKLTLTSSTVSFPSANPDTTPLVAGVPASIGITARVRSTPGSTVVLSVLAQDDLRAVGATIPAGAIVWTASGNGYLPGTMSRTAAQPVAMWTRSGQWNGTQSYQLTNSWSYTVGSYSAQLTYTLSAP